MTLCRRAALFALALVLVLPLRPAQAEDLLVYHSGSLVKVMADMARAFTSDTGLSVALVGGSSGKLAQRIEQGERPDLFASGDMETPAALAAKGLAGPPVRYARNSLAVLAPRRLGITPANLLDKLLAPDLRLAASSPGIDPGGNYTWQMFDKAEALRPGAGRILKDKAGKLSGGQAEAHTMLGRADAFVLYVTTARLAASVMPDMEIIALPAELAVESEDGLALLPGARPGAAALRDYMLGPKGQAILRGYGFLAP